jgi:hypothetical protein
MYVRSFPSYFSIACQAILPILILYRFTAATFSSGVKFEFNIEVGANFKNTGEAVGVADNGFENFTIFKDNNRVMFRTADGFECQTVYFAH